MHVGWSADERPRWRVEAVFDLIGAEPGRPGPGEAIDLERMLAATGKVRAPRVVLRRGRLELGLTLKAEDDLAAAVAGLTILDVAVRQVPLVRLGELIARSVRAR